jgi:hypothetical protein
MEQAPKIDHDRLFKELLTTFFVEFIELFFPKLAAVMDRDSIVFLDKEVFISLFDGREYEADIVARVRFANTETEAFFLIHVENQSSPEADFGRRMLRYFTGFFEKYDLPVYPIVVFSYDKPARAEPTRYTIGFPDGEVLRYSYRVVQLNRLSWRKFVSQHNPIASALMAKMKIAEQDRPRVKLECLRLLATLKLDPARMRLISGFVDTYLRLSRQEIVRFEQAIAGSDLAPAEKEEVMEIVTSWMETGIERGLLQGRLEGIAQGERELFLRLARLRLGEPEAAILERVLGASQTTIEGWADRLLHAESWQELLTD